MMNTTSLPATRPCPYCGNVHTTVCPMVKAIEYHADGVTVKRVEFKTANDYPPVTVAGSANWPFPTHASAKSKTSQFQDSADNQPQVQG